MRHCTFLAVLLILVLSLLKGKNAETTEKVMKTTTGNNGTENGTTTEPSQAPGNNGTENGTTTEPSQAPGNNDAENGTTTEPSQAPGNNGTENGTTTEPSQAPGNNGTENGTTTEPSQAPGNNDAENGTTTEPSQAPGNNGTENGTTTEPSQAPGNNGTENGTTTEPSQAPGNNGTENGTTTEPSQAPGNNDTENGTTTEPSQAPGNNDTENGTTIEPPKTPGNDTDIESTTEPPKTPGNNDTENGTTTEPPQTLGNFCDGDPCGNKWAKCVALATNYTCLCQYGFYYSNKDCHKGEVYPGVITLQEDYKENIQTVNSTEYEKMFMTITDFFKNAFSDFETYEQTVILKIQPTEVRAASVSVTVTNLFMESSGLTNVTVQNAITTAAINWPGIMGYRSESYCAAFNCDNQTTECKEMMFPECICRSNFSKTEWDDRSCSDCKDCSDRDKKYCVKENGIPICKCRLNFEMKGGTCVACAVGYSGENCENNSELILIIVGTVLGAIVLSLLIAISIVSVRAKHKDDPEKMTLINSGHSNPNTSGDKSTTLFPRVQTTSGHSNPGYQPNNPYETHSTKRGRFPERDYDDLYEMPQEPEGFRTQSRY